MLFELVEHSDVLSLLSLSCTADVLSLCFSERNEWSHGVLLYWKPPAAGEC
jgi:hypothetical protein